MTPSDTAHPEGDRTTKQYWVDLLFEVQTGHRSCRNMADLILAALSTPPSRPQGEEGLREAREDLHSHRLAWRHALELALERADHPTEDADDRSYWGHELTVFDRVFAALSNQGKPSS